MGAMRLKLDAKEPIEHILHDLDPLMIAIGLALASLAPGPAGEAGAVAAIVFDVKCRRWGGVILSAASMIPVVGYVPAIVKVALLVFLLNRGPHFGIDIRNRMLSLVKHRDSQGSTYRYRLTGRVRA